jgi:hypothetical protein
MIVKAFSKFCIKAAEIFTRLYLSVLCFHLFKNGYRKGLTIAESLLIK